MAPTRRPDPYVGFPFIVEINGGEVAGFSEASGVEAETDVEDRLEGGMNDFVHKLAKHTKYSNISLKRGITAETELWDWYQEIVAGRIERKTISVILMDVKRRTEKWRWVFKDAWPVKWSGSGLNASTSAVFVESVDFAHHGLSKV